MSISFSSLSDEFSKIPSPILGGGWWSYITSSSCGDTITNFGIEISMIIFSLCDNKSKFTFQPLNDFHQQFFHNNCSCFLHSRWTVLLSIQWYKMIKLQSLNFNSYIQSYPITSSCLPVSSWYSPPLCGVVCKCEVKLIEGFMSVIDTVHDMNDFDMYTSLLLFKSVFEPFVYLFLHYHKN